MPANARCYKLVQSARLVVATEIANNPFGLKQELAVRAREDRGVIRAYGTLKKTKET